MMRTVLPELFFLVAPLTLKASAASCISQVALRCRFTFPCAPNTAFSNCGGIRNAVISKCSGLELQ
jgi:hypothetical protein